MFVLTSVYYMYYCYFQKQKQQPLQMSHNLSSELNHHHLLFQLKIHLQDMVMINFNFFNHKNLKGNKIIKIITPYHLSRCLIVPTRFCIENELT